MADPTLNAGAQGQGPAYPLTAAGGVSGPGVIPPSQGLTKHDALVQAVFMNQPLLEALASNGGSFTKNVVDKSEDFAAAGPGWTPLNSANTANAGQSPYGSKTGSRLTENGAAGKHENACDPVPVTAFALLGVSIYAFAETRTKVSLGISDGGAGDFADLIFDLETRQVSPGLLSGGLTIIGDPIFTDEGAGWFRIGFLILNTNQPSRDMHYGLCDADGNQSYTGDTTSSALFYGAQLESGVNLIHAYKKKPIAGGAASTFTPDRLARFVRDFATEVMTVRADDLRDA